MMKMKGGVERSSEGVVEGFTSSMLKLSSPLTKSLSSLENYIKSIGRNYSKAVMVMGFLIGATYLTVMVALDRHALQQDSNSLTSSQFIRFQQLANQTR